MKNLSLLLLFLLVACTNEIAIENPIVVPPTSEDGSITFTIKLPGNSSPMVYGATEEEETKVVELDVLAFSNEAGVDKFNYRVQIDPSKISDAPDADFGKQKLINFVLRRQEKAVRLMVIANARKMLNNATITQDMSADDIMDQLIYTNTDTFNAFPMWGQSSDYFTVKDPIVESKRTITLLRSVSKIDLGVDVYGDPAIGFGQLFKLTSVRVYNKNNKGTVAPVLSDPGIAIHKVTQPNVPSGTGKISDPFLYFINTSSNQFYNEIYVPEMAVPESQDGNQAMFLIIGGSYNGSQETYYKVNFVNNQKELIPLLRNHRYLVNITGVNGKGALTVDEALNGKTANLIYSLGVTNEVIRDITFNGQYMLGVNDTHFSHDWIGDGFDIHSIVCATDYPTGVSATTNVDWIELINPNTGNGSSQNFAVRYRLSPNVDLSASARKGIITIKAGLIEKEIAIKQYAPSNCCIIKPNTVGYLSCVLADQDGIDRKSLSRPYMQSKVLWKDSPGPIGATFEMVKDPVSGQRLHVKASNKEENFILGVYESNQLIWAFHVMITNNDPRESTTMIGMNEFMTRNLGASNATPGHSGSIGYIYQWGRPMPFPGASSLAVGTTTTSKIYDESGVELLNAIKVKEVDQDNNFWNAITNPTTFYTNKQFPFYSWTGLSETNNLLWVSENGEKTLYDPCPDGWRVPNSATGTYSVWASLTTANAIWNLGYYWQNGRNGYFPATGGYDFSTGKLVDVGVRNYTWSGAASGVKAYLLNIGQGSINTQSSGYRANGYPVRCVREAEQDRI